MINHNEINLEILQLASGHFLCQPYPQDWENMSDKEQDEYILAHAWQPFEDYDSEYVRSCIDNAAQVTQEFINNHQN